MSGAVRGRAQVLQEGSVDVGGVLAHYDGEGAAALVSHGTTDSGTAPPFALPISDAGEIFLVGNADLHIGVDHAPTGQEVSFVDESLIQPHL